MTITTAPQTGIPVLHLVHNSVYLDPAIFAAEQERIFGKVWNFVCHESEIARPGDYITRDVAGCPMIITRDKTGRLHAFYNTCPHRGSLVALQPRGNCKAFLCPYHNWTFSLDGRLTGVPGLESFAGTGFRKEDFGLHEARIDSLHGLVFVCQSDDTPSLADYIGPEMAAWLYKPLGLAEFELIEYRTIEVRANWKLNAENARDGYHVPNLHPFLRKASRRAPYHIYEPHALQEMNVNDKALSPELWRSMNENALPGMNPHGGYVAVLFPDTFLKVMSDHVAIHSQIALAPDRIITEDRVLGLKGDPEEVKECRRKSWRPWLGDRVEFEDLPQFERVQRGITNRHVPIGIIPRQGEAFGNSNQGDDERIRVFWKYWREMMGLRQNAAPTVQLI
ncbi:MAG TPA: aromatic ring-hydroxylating dioxygenase subunit alpha [Chloroflexota bacterium]|nr:aromatic ring-hydroxylating dioxygenase subunit alpha [Chloroflexota bacterium]